MAVEVDRLTRVFGKQKALDQVSFNAVPGEILGFLGPNGAGKSTTMKIATTFLPPSSGKVTVCGYDVMEKPLEVRKMIGYLPEHNPLYLDMYVHEYLHFAGSVHGLLGKDLKRRVMDMIDLCGLGLEQNKKVEMLSKGYRQRLGLAQALIHDPPVLILDEPTTGLDPNQILEIRNLIRNISKNKTVIFSTHIMQEVQAICDRVVIINRGKIVADNAIEALKSGVRHELVILAEFKTAVNENLLKSINGVTAVNALPFNKYEIRSNPEHDVRAEIFNLATREQWILLGLSQQEKTMENVFQELTGKNQPS